MGVDKCFLIKAARRSPTPPGRVLHTNRDRLCGQRLARTAADSFISAMSATTTSPGIALWGEPRISMLRMVILRSPQTGLNGRTVQARGSPAHNYSRGCGAPRAVAVWTRHATAWERIRRNVDRRWKIVDSPAPRRDFRFLSSSWEPRLPTHPSWPKPCWRDATESPATTGLSGILPRRL